MRLVRPEIWIAVLLVAATCAAFSPLAAADFIGHYQEGLALEPGDAQARARLAKSLEHVRAGDRLRSP